jgi:hypothetical protein
MDAAGTMMIDADAQIILVGRIRHFSPINEAEAFDYFELFVRGSGETEATLCGYDVATVRDKTRFWHDRTYVVGQQGEDGWKKEILIDTIIDYPDTIDKDCQSQVFKTLEMKWDEGHWETIWNELINVEEQFCDYKDGPDGTIQVDCSTSGNDGSVRIETEDDLTNFVIEITHEDFMEGQMMFGTDDSTILIDMALVYRDGEGNAIEQLTQNFTLNVTDPTVVQEQDCLAVRLSKKQSIRYDQTALFKNESGVSMASFGKDNPLKIDFQELEASGCAEKPFYELYVADQSSTPIEYYRFSYLWNRFREQFPTVATVLKSKFTFNETNGDFSINFNYDEFMTFKQVFMTQYESIDFKIVARLHGSEYDGASAYFMDLQSVDFTLTFIEPEKADECANHKLVLTGTEVNGGESR